LFRYELRLKISILSHGENFEPEGHPKRELVSNRVEGVFKTISRTISKKLANQRGGTPFTPQKQDKIQKGDIDGTGARVAFGCHI
jgi:hypothetical protein